MVTPCLSMRTLREMEGRREGCSALGFRSAAAPIPVLPYASMPWRHLCSPRSSKLSRPPVTPDTRWWHLWRHGGFPRRPLGWNQARSELGSPICPLITWIRSLIRVRIHVYLCAHTCVIPKLKDQNSLQKRQQLQLHSFVFPLEGWQIPWWCASRKTCSAASSSGGCRSWGQPGSQQKPIQNSCTRGLGIYFMSVVFGTLGVSLYANVHVVAMNPSP